MFVLFRSTKTNAYMYLYFSVGKDDFLVWTSSYMNLEKCMNCYHLVELHVYEFSTYLGDLHWNMALSMPPWITISQPKILVLLDKIPSVPMNYKLGDDRAFGQSKGTTPFMLSGKLYEKSLLVLFKFNVMSSLMIRLYEIWKLNKLSFVLPGLYAFKYHFIQKICLYEWPQKLSFITWSARHYESCSAKFWLLL